MPDALPKRVLVVDDDEEMLSLVRRLFANAGYEVVTAGDGAAAIERLDADIRWTAVVTDKDMPNATGFDVAKRVHELDPAVPVVMMTAHGARLPRESVRDIDAYVPKPFRTPGQIVDAVADAIQMRGSKVQGERLKRTLDSLKKR